jgi:hypothetical protein
MAICLVALCHIVYRRIYSRFLNVTYALCDSASSDIELFEALPYHKAIFAAKLSFELEHPTAHRWKLFQSLMQKYPDDRTVLILFARYAAIYATEDSMLCLAAMRLSMTKSGRLGMKRLLFDVLSLIQQRESTLSEPIRKALNYIREYVEKMRTRAMAFWESIIRRSLHELEGRCTCLKATEADVIYNFNHLCLVYPNNPFVAHAYGQFLYEILNNVSGATRMFTVARYLRLGYRVRIERSAHFAE